MKAGLPALVCALGFLPLLVLSQNQWQGHYMVFGLGAGHETSLDQALSPVRYAGWLGQAQIGYQYQNQRWRSDFNISGLGGFQKAQMGSSERQLTAGLARGHYSLSYRVGRQKDWQVFAGLVSQNLWNFHQHSNFSNNRTSISGLFSYGFQATGQYAFSLKGKKKTLRFGLEQSLVLPVGSYLMRPGYVRPFFQGEVSYRNHHSWNSVLHWQNRSALIYFIPSGNQLRLQYQWEYFQADVLNFVASGGHSLSLNFWFTF